jgi:SAM-dependent methyltransferase
MNFWERGRQALARGMGVDLTHSQVHYARVLDGYVQPGCRWLEVGCGRQVLPQWAMPLPHQRDLVARSHLLIGMDVDNALLEHPLLTQKVIGLGDTMPFQSGSFDLVSANMVIEHVSEPHQFLVEVHRVLQSGGCFLFHTPNFHNFLILIAYFVPDRIKEKIIWLLERRKAEDVFPTRYRMNTTARIRKLAGATGFRIERLTVNGTVGSFGGLGPLGWIEVAVMKAVSIPSGTYNTNLICVLRRD